ncbi:hypothetical protein AMATHDRAFT_57502 [Amanita thiersii Skay4041]|uniref:Potassium transport protein n=1 Tax=Amanita thiersii Skay4041 TaxID=703135 RepID=A0A2A9NS37_9AGAR|nr:hypothetical protein AMATHDRAFT_57502 [Amanita thiersii Skay4041]
METSSSSLKAFGKFLRQNLNFYRVHILYFTFAPIFWACIFYASNGKHKIPFIDALFNSVSAIAMCGLATVDLSSLTPWQQTILFIQMITGSPVLVSWVMVYIRRYYFAKKFKHIIDTASPYKTPSTKVTASSTTKVNSQWIDRLRTFFHPRKQISVEEKEIGRPVKLENTVNGGARFIRKLTPDMIRRIDERPKPVNPSGWVSEEMPPSDRRIPSNLVPPPPLRQEPDHRLSITGFSSVYAHEPSIQLQLPAQIAKPPRYNSISRHRDVRMTRRLSDPGVSSRPSSPVRTSMQRFETVASGLHFRRSKGIGARSQTVEFAPSGIPRRRLRRDQLGIPEAVAERGHAEIRSARRPSIVPAYSLNTNYSLQPVAMGAKDRDFGGFPTPFELLRRFLDRFAPSFKRRLTRTVTIPTTMSLVSDRPEAPPGAKTVPYISFDAIVGRNSAFHLLTNEQLEELGGVEYRALNALLWLIAGYYICVQMIAFVVIAPYISRARWASTFVPPMQHRPLNPVWFSAFQVVSAFSNTGTSLVDQSMVPFQEAYPMIFLMIFQILAGNTCFPIFMRFTIWVITKLVPKSSRANETLHFLLDHPRRCYIYLFPSHQTWFLLTIVFVLTATDWFFFLVLDIGNAVIDQIPVGVRVLAGFFQAVAVRAAGFAIVSISALAPAVKILYIIMMYISVFPIAMSVRSTNVYEERSLGIYRDYGVDEDQFNPTGTRVSVWSNYLALHARKQLAFDMWWLATALFLVCIIERDNIENPEFYSWFTVLNIIFDVVSAYGTVGLSVGLPSNNYSFCGSFRPLSKLIICAVMLRGRHRGLPVAIDRAVMLPNEVWKREEDDSRSYSSHSHHSTGVHRPGGDLDLDQQVAPMQQQRWRRYSSRRSVEGDPIIEERRHSDTDEENAQKY